jgi:hypothetical protein
MEDIGEEISVSHIPYYAIEDTKYCCKVLVHFATVSDESDIGSYSDSYEMVPTSKPHVAKSATVKTGIDVIGSYESHNC